MGIIDQLQISDRMLDLGALEEALAAIDPIRQAGREQRMLDHARLRIRPVQHRNLAAQPAFGNQALGFLDQPLRFLQIAGGFENTYLLAMTRISAQVLAQTTRSIRD